MGVVISMQRSCLLDATDVREDHGAVRREAAQQRTSPSHTEGLVRRAGESCCSQWKWEGAEPEQASSGCSCPWRTRCRRTGAHSCIRLKPQRLRHQEVPVCESAKQSGRLLSLVATIL